MKSRFSPILILFILGIALQSCAQIKGEGPIVKKDLQTEEFSGVELKGSFKVVVEQGDQAVWAEGHGNIIDRLDLEVSGDLLKVKLEKGNYRDFELTVYVTTRNLTKIAVAGSGDMSVGAFKALDQLEVEVAGSGEIIGKGLLSVGEDAEVEVAGSGDIGLEIEAESLEVSIAGSGDVKLSGKAKTSEVSIAGSGDYNGKDLICSSAEVDIAGSGDAHVNVEKLLEVSIAGSGDVSYRGNPKVSSNVMGSGDVRASK